MKTAHRYQLFAWTACIALAAGLPERADAAGQAMTWATGWVPTGKLNTSRDLHTATLLRDGTVLVTGGYHGSGPGRLDSAERYDPATGIWSLTGPMGRPRVLHTATLLPDGRVLVVGGDSSSTPPSFGRSNTAELYDPATGTWEPTSSMSTAHSWHTATPLKDGRVLVAGGANHDNVATAELYDPRTGVWTTTGSLNVARYAHTATRLLDGSVLVARGSDDGDLFTTLASAERYDPDTGLWSVVDPSSWSSVGHTATLLADGNVLVTGGVGGYIDPYPTTAELFDPLTLKWRRIAANARMFHTATLLLDGNVLVAGGNERAELYDVRTASWRDAGAFTTPRHTATLLSDGRVLFVGGDVANIFGVDDDLPECEKNHYILSAPCRIYPE